MGLALVSSKIMCGSRAFVTDFLSSFNFSPLFTFRHIKSCDTFNINVVFNLLNIKTGGKRRFLWGCAGRGPFHPCLSQGEGEWKSSSDTAFRGRTVFGDVQCCELAVAVWTFACWSVFWQTSSAPLATSDFLQGFWHVGLSIPLFEHFPCSFCHCSSSITNFAGPTGTKLTLTGIESFRPVFLLSCQESLKGNTLSSHRSFGK